MNLGFVSLLVQLGATGGVLTIFWYALTWREQRQKLRSGNKLTEAESENTRADGASVLTGAALKMVDAADARSERAFQEAEAARAEAAELRAENEELREAVNEARREAREAIAVAESCREYVQTLIEQMRTEGITPAPVPLRLMPKRRLGGGPELAPNG